MKAQKRNRYKKKLSIKNYFKSSYKSSNMLSNLGHLHDFRVLLKMFLHVSKDWYDRDSWWNYAVVTLDISSDLYARMLFAKKYFAK